MTALDKLLAKNNDGKFICIGLDTDINKIPAHLKSADNPVLEFNKAIVERTSGTAAAFKINFAFYENSGDKGYNTLKETIRFIPEDILIIGDAKRGDIGNTAKMYADSVFNFFGCDASTINPYMGEDSVLPFLEKKDKLNFILALTSNAGADDFEKLKLKNGKYLFQEVIEKVKSWNKNKNCGIVFGATKTEELKNNINSFGDLPVLLPGIGAQGGNLEEVISIFKKSYKNKFLINISRGIIYKSSGKDFAAEAEKEVLRYNELIKSISS